MWEKDNNSQIEWLIKIMANGGFNLDFSINSLIDIDKFFQLNYRKGKLLRNSKFRIHFFSNSVILHSLNLYIEKILIKIPGTKKIDFYFKELNERIYGLKVGNVEVYTLQMLLKRAQYGFEHSLYPYYYELTKQYFVEDFQNSFYKIEKLKPVKTWYQIW